MTRSPLSIGLVLAASAITAATAATAADLGPASPALCSASQQVLFHCSLGAKAVSLCGDVAGERLTALNYRFGTAKRVEMAYAANTANGRRFTASNSALAPRAQVRQMWFDNGGYRYLLSQCVGGDCAFDAGLSVLRKGKLVSNRHCLRTEDDRARFSPTLGKFGEDAAASRSNTELLQFDDVDNGVEKLYPVR